MLMELTDGKLRELVRKGLTAWEILLVAYLDGVGVGHELTPVSVQTLKQDLMLPSSTQTRLLKGLVEKGVIHVDTTWTGKQRRHVAFTLKNRNRSSAAPGTRPKSTTPSTASKSTPAKRG